MRVGLALTVAAVVVGACGPAVATIPPTAPPRVAPTPAFFSLSQFPSPSTSASASIAPSPAPSTPAASSGPVGSSAALGPSATAGPSAYPTPSGSGPFAVVDTTLLAILPATVAGDTVNEYPDAEHQAAVEADLGRNISRIATAFVGDPAGVNWAYTAVVEVRPDARTDAFYRDWQETFDASACERAGGVMGHTTVEIAGRSVERTACGGGVRTYHVRIDGTGLLISVSDLGDQRFGELVIAGLRP